MLGFVVPTGWYHIHEVHSLNLSACSCFRMVKKYTKLHASLSPLEYFFERTWKWTHDNVDTLTATLSETDRQVCFWIKYQQHIF